MQISLKFDTEHERNPQTFSVFFFELTSKRSEKSFTFGDKSEPKFRNNKKWDITFIQNIHI